MTDGTRTQLDKFKEAARQLETDDNPARFKKQLARGVKHKPVEREAKLKAAPIALLVLAGCQVTKADDRICSSAPSAVAQGDVAACVHKWSYRLAGASGSAMQIAEAVLGACDDVIAFKANADKNDAVPSSYGENVDALTFAARRQAVFCITQARAGRCEIS